MHCYTVLKIHETNSQSVFEICNSVHECTKLKDRYRLKVQGKLNFKGAPFNAHVQVQGPAKIRPAFLEYGGNKHVLCSLANPILQKYKFLFMEILEQATSHSFWSSR